MQLIFATHNTHKVSEIKRILPPQIHLITPYEMGFTGDIPETGKTLEENALQKAVYIFEKYKQSCLADDTGLEVDALGGRPGVYSARYADEEGNAEKNIEKLLHELEGTQNRSAVFKTVIAIIINGQQTLFEGSVKGKITRIKQGKSGFGYDPVFIPDGQSLSYAQMSMDEKNALSHRAIAVEKLFLFLKKCS